MLTVGLHYRVVASSDRISAYVFDDLLFIGEEYTPQGRQKSSIELMVLP